MKKAILSDLAPAPIGPYSQAIEANGMVFVSGQIALDQATGNLINDTIESETHQVFKNLIYILEARGLTLDHVVKASVFVKRMGDFALINSIYQEYFKGDTPPARETVEVAALPRYVNIEISVIAVV